MDCLAAVFREIEKPLSLERIALEPPTATEVMVHIAAIGLCRTDYHVMRGERRVAMTPMVLDHEAAGVVEAIGAEVQGIAPGDHVVLTFIPACGTCRWCRQGLHHLCAEGLRITQGPQLDGTYRRRDQHGADVGAFCMIGASAERTVMDQASVVVIDKDLPLDLASLVACGVPAGVGAARHRARVKPGDSVLVVGCGGDGMNVVQGARLCGAAKIIAADIVPAKLDWARDFGATDGVNARGEALTRAVHELTDGVGVDHAFVCIDPPETLLPAFRATAKAGNVVVTALTPDTVGEIKIPPLELFATQKAVMGAVYGFTSQRVQIPELLRLYRSGDLKLRELVTRTYRLDEINQGYADLEAGKNLRGVVVLGARWRRWPWRRCWRLLLKTAVEFFETIQRTLYVPLIHVLELRARHGLLRADLPAKVVKLADGATIRIDPNKVAGPFAHRGGFGRRRDRDLVFRRKDMFRNKDLIQPHIRRESQRAEDRDAHDAHPEAGPPAAAQCCRVLC